MSNEKLEFDYFDMKYFVKLLIINTAILITLKKYILGWQVFLEIQKRPFRNQDLSKTLLPEIYDLLTYLDGLTKKDSKIYRRF